MLFAEGISFVGELAPGVERRSVAARVDDDSCASLVARHQVLIQLILLRKTRPKSQSRLSHLFRFGGYRLALEAAEPP